MAFTNTVHSFSFDPTGGSSGSNPSGIQQQTVSIVDAMVQGTSVFVPKTIGGVSVNGHDSGSYVAGYGVGTLQFTVVTSTPAVNPQGYRANILKVDGKFRAQLINTVENASQTFSVDVGNGDGKVHYWEFWEAGNYDPNPANTTYTVLTQVAGVCSVLSTPVNRPLRIMEFGDSISAGTVQSFPLLGGIGFQTRNILNGDVAVNAIAGRKSGDCPPSTFANAAVLATSGGTTRAVVMLLGVNDYLNNVPIATFTSNITALKTALTAADSGCTFYSIGISITTLESTANSVGKLPSDYRAALSGIFGGNYFDSSTWAAASYLQDTVHLNPEGSALIAGHVASLF